MAGSTHAGMTAQWRVACASAVAAMLGCAPPTFILDEAATTSDGSITLTPAGSGSGSSTTAATSVGTGPGVCGVDLTCPSMIDLLFVIDNSGTMGEEQLNLARNFPMLIEELEALKDINGEAVEADVNIMVTTTDFGNPNCDESKPPDYVEAKGAPISTPCTDRISRFTGRGTGAPQIEDACYEVCDRDAPAYPLDQFIHFDPGGTNVEGGTPAQALACVGPQGIDGCGFEAPLETMLQALNPGACWNDPQGVTWSECEGEGFELYDEAFLRDGAILAIAIITDETDCSVKEYGIMNDPMFMATEPEDGIRMPSSAICWNAGVLCSDLDPDTEQWSGCLPANRDLAGDIGVIDDEAVLHPLSRYTRLLNDFRGSGREVIMLGVLGVPLVTAHNEDPPHEPTEGGVKELVFRNWRDPEYPAGDILPSEWMAGTMAENKQFEFGIGPGCTEVTPSNVGQGIPPVRIRSVCESLNVPDDPETAVNEEKTRCCIESVCGEDFSPAMRCLTGLIRNVIPPVE